MPLVINGEEVDDRVIEEEFDAMKQHHEALGEVVCCDRDEEFRERAIEHVINRTLLRQECLRRLGEAPAEEIDAAIAELIERHGGEENLYKNTGFQSDQQDAIRQRVAETVNVTRILEEHLGPDPEPDEVELRRFLEDHKTDYLTPEEVHSWHIYLEPHGNDDAVRCYEALRSARREILSGADFETKAKEMCLPEHVMDLGFYRQGSMVREVEIVTFSMDVGEISPVVSTHFGYHIFKVIDRKPPEPLPFEQVRDHLAERYPREWRERRIQELIDELKSSATITRVATEPAFHG